MNNNCNGNIMSVTDVDNHWWRGRINWKFNCSKIKAHVVHTFKWKILRTKKKNMIKWAEKFFFFFFFWKKFMLLTFYNWATSWQNQQNDCAPSKDSDQPGHPPSLIRVFAVCMKKPWVLSYPLSAWRRLWSDWADAKADLSVRRAHTHFIGFVMSWFN